MRVQIDATVVAHELALDEILMEKGLMRDEEGAKIVEKSIEEDVDNFNYQIKYDYYFKILTNHAL